MKKIFLTILYIQLTITFLNAQWVWQNSGITTPIRDVKLINRYTGWACGDGVILKTTNAGINWTVQTQPATNKFLFSINPINENVVYCVGWFETILKTTNGGANWLAIRNGPDATGASYWASYFLNTNTGWVAGSNQKILKTTNGGISFDSIPVVMGNIMDIYFKDSLSGILCGEVGLVRKTTNGGNTWNSVNIQLYGNMYNFYKISIINNQYGWLVGNINPVYRTTDFGSNWDSVGYVTGSNEIYFSVFSSVNTGWAGGTYGRMFKTTNSGYTWTRENTGSFTGYIREGYFFNDSVGWIVGGGGRIQYTTSSGQVMQITKNKEQIADEFVLHQNYPNPFNSETNIKYQITKNSFVVLKLYNILGKEIATLVNEKQLAGEYEVNWNAENFSSGLYFYKITSGDFSDVKKMLLLK